jgi:hypothetical protein
VTYLGCFMLVGMLVVLATTVSLKCTEISVIVKVHKAERLLDLLIAVFTGCYLRL